MVQSGGLALRLRPGLRRCGDGGGGDGVRCDSVVQSSGLALRLRPGLRRCGDGGEGERVRCDSVVTTVEVTERGPTRHEQVGEKNARL